MQSLKAQVKGQWIGVKADKVKIFKHNINTYIFFFTFYL